MFTPEQIAKELVDVQPMNNINWNGIAEHPLWQSFVDRHFKVRGIHKESE